MQFIDLKAQYNALRKQIDKSIKDVLQRGEYILGPQVQELEHKLKTYVGRKYCVTCANGTDALQIVLMAWGVQKGDAVFIPSFTFMATAEVVSLQGATPVFVDIDADTFNINPISLEKAINKVIEDKNLNAKAIIAVDLFGLPADYEKIIPIAKKYGLLLLEDGAQGFGGTQHSKKACSFGDASTTSFFPAKPLGCYGDGGAIFTDDQELYETIISVRTHGKDAEKYNNVRVGINSRLDTLQAAILLVKLKAFEEYELRERQKVASIYTEQLKDIIKTPIVPKGYTSSWAQYTLFLKDKCQRDNLQEKLKERDIPAMIYYPKPIHKQKVYSDLKYEDEDLQFSQIAAYCVLSIPMHPYLHKDTIEFICNTIRLSLL